MILKDLIVQMILMQITITKCWCYILKLFLEMKILL